MTLPVEILEYAILPHLLAASLFACSMVCHHLRNLALRLLAQEQEQTKCKQQEFILDDCFRDGSISLLRWLQVQFNFPSWKAQRYFSTKEHMRQQLLLHDGLCRAAHVGHLHMLQQLFSE